MATTLQAEEADMTRQPRRDPSRMNALSGLHRYMTIENFPEHLRVYVNDNPSSALAVFSHPVLVSLIPLFLPEKIETYIDLRRARANEALENGNPHAYVDLFEKPYRGDALVDIALEGVFDADPETYWSIAASVWVAMENDEADPVWSDMLQFPLGSPADMMNAEESKAFRDMANRITIHRGVTAKCRSEAEGEVLNGFSWSLSADTARWFARRLRVPGETPPPWVASAIIPRDSALAYLSRRGENEIIVDPDEIDRVGHIHRLVSV